MESVEPQASSLTENSVSPNCSTLRSTPIPINSPSTKFAPYITTESSPDDLPTIVVINSDGQPWGSGDLAEIHGLNGTPESPPSCSLYYSPMSSPVTSSENLEILNNSGMEKRSHSHGDFRPIKNRGRANSLQCQDLAYSSTRFCASQGQLNVTENLQDTKSKKKLKNKFLEVFNPKTRMRQRSASTEDDIFKPSSSPSHAKRMKDFFNRMRSQSQGDIIIPPLHNIHPSLRSTEDLDEDEDNENVEDNRFYPSQDEDESYEEDIAKTSTNTSLLSKFKKQLGKNKDKQGTSNNLKSPRRNSDYLNNNEDNIVEVPGESNDDFPENYLQPDQIFLNIPKRSRSKSEPRIVVDRKLKRKAKLDFKDFNIFSKLRERRQKKRDRAGSLPDILDDFGTRRGNAKQHPLIAKHGSITLSQGEGLNVSMGELAIENYFGENSEKLSLENLTETGETEKSNFKSNQSKFDTMVNNFRGKSRSMDYTLQRPFDLDMLRRKIGERTSSEPTRDTPPDSSDLSNNASEKRSTPRTFLSGPTISYTIQASDTLMSIAARFDTTPSELTKLNRLSTRFLFPGQQLIVPDKGGSKENQAESMGEEGGSYKDSQSSPFLSDLAPQISPQIGPFPRTPATSVDTDRSLDKECLEKFLKIQVRHITDGQGVVAGVLLVTPNAVMFDPNVSDPLVIERGSESYGVIAPMDFVVNAALYYDIAHMKVKDTCLPKPDIPKPEIYYGPVQHVEEPAEEHMDIPSERLLPTGEVGGLGGSEESPSKDGAFPELASQDNDNDSSCSCGGDTRETSAFPKAFEHEILTPISSDSSPTGIEGQNPLSLQGDLAPIAEVSKPEEPTVSPDSVPPNQLAQSQCDTTSSQDPAQDTNLQLSSLPSVTNDKKRTTSVTFNASSESDMPPLPEDEGEIPCQESRKQKVLKRISYPLSWMESFTADKEGGHMLGQHQSMPSSAPPGGNWVPGAAGITQPPGVDTQDGSRPGMFSNVFSMSNVSNMLTRRPSLDFARRPLSQNAASDPHQLNPSALSTLSSEYSVQQAQKRAQFKDGPKFGLKSMVSMDDMPELFASFDKLIPKPASSCDESPLYLCLRMGIPMEKQIPRTTPIMTYGKKTMRPEYWFSIPKDRTDELYRFFQIWAAEIYGELDEEMVRSKGFVVIDEEIEIIPLGAYEEDDVVGLGPAGELKEMTKESWEVVSMSEELRKALYSSSSLTSLDIEVFLPEIHGITEIIDDYIRKNMYRKLPARVQGYNWKLVFSTAQHGFSLKSLYRKMQEIDSPIILFIQDTNQNKFGAVLSCPLRVSELFYGTGESFLFVCKPEFKIFAWTGENNFFVKGNNESLFIGGGDGKFGIWLDGDLYQGRTQPCTTFNNPLLSDSEDFIIKTIECWYFD